MKEQLRKQTVRAMGVLALGGGVTKLISFTTTLILARLLSPEDYGLMALAMVVVGLISFFNDAGLGAAIVQRTDLDRRSVNGCFVISMLLGAVLTLVCAAGSIATAKFYGKPILAPIVAVLGLSFLIGSVGSIPQAYLRREMRFRPLVNAGIVSVAAQSAVVLSCAWSGLGVWSLVWGSLTGSSIQVLFVWIASGWRPTGGIDLKGASHLVRYGMTITSSSFLTFFYQNIDRVIVGRILGERAVGFQEMAISLAALPVTQVTGLVTNVSSPLFSKLQNEPKRVAEAIFKLSRGIAYLTFPMCAGMVITAPDLIPILLGSQWLDLIVPFQLLALTVLVRSPDPLLSQALISTGNAARLVRYAVISCVVLPGAIAVGAWTGGLVGVASAMLLALPCLTTILVSDCASLFGFSALAYFRELAKASLGTLVMAAATIATRLAAEGLGFHSMAALAIQVLAGVSVYLAWFCFGDTNTLNEIRQLLQDLGLPERHLKRWPFAKVAPKAGHRP